MIFHEMYMKHSHQIKLIMKKFISFTLVLALVTSISQAQGTLTASSVMAPEGTSLGANETIAYNGIALGNRVKMRGFVDFICIPRCRYKRR